MSELGHIIWWFVFLVICYFIIGPLLHIATIAYSHITADMLPY